MTAPAAPRLLLVLLLLLAASSAIPRAAAQVAPAERAYWPTSGWRTAAPEAQGMDPVLLAALDQRVPAELPLLSGLVVVRGGEIIFERKALDWASLMAELDDTAPAEVLAGLARYS